MPDLSRVLVVAATPRELAPSDGWATLACGVGPVEAAATTAAAIAAAIVARRPAAIVHVGIAGSRQGSGLEPPMLVIGAEARYDDVAASNAWVPRVLVPDARLLAAAQRALPSAAVRTIGTSARVGGTVDVPVEAMEGYAVLRAAALADVPAVEVRAIANDIGEPDRGRWQFDAAFAAITAATPAIVREVAACLR
ncbi:MAG: hypothetical protein MUF53_04165 [Gemmatimonadaceae bacterium]|nr:hypothetical protein [Gemmatimonadaceae bacterium]